MMMKTIVVRSDSSVMFERECVTAIRSVVLADRRGISPHDMDVVLLVLRCTPIRVMFGV